MIKSHIEESLKHKIEQRKPDAKEYMLYDLFYIKSKAHRTYYFLSGEWLLSWN